jgi:predicted benzoate:H+ symporter BenE
MSFDYKKLVKFQINVGDKDKSMRLIAGSVLLFISVFTAKIILLVAGIALIATGYSRFCPAYAAMDKNTCDTTEKTTK